MLPTAMPPAKGEPYLALGFDPMNELLWYFPRVLQKENASFSTKGPTSSAYSPQIRTGTLIWYNAYARKKKGKKKVKLERKQLLAAAGMSAQWM